MSGGTAAGLLGETGKRIVSGAVLAAAAIAVAWQGGVLLWLFWGLVALGVLMEWHRLTRGGGVPWLAGGIAYAAVLALAPILLRADAAYGFAALMWLFAVVWATDIMAYVTGRAFGGPKLLPSISPKKTWSGFLGGTAFGTAAGTAAAFLSGAPVLGPVALISLLASVATHGGDLFESWAKRRFGAKDSGHIIPGHGGLMDRLDGFVAAAALAVVIGIGRAGLEGAGRGLLQW